MKKIITIFCVLICALATHATESQESELTEKEMEEFYISQCRSVDEMAKILNEDVKDITESDMIILIESRKMNISIIREGAPAIKRVIEDGSRSDTGPFGAMLACGVVNYIEAKVKERGCLDLETNEVIMDGPGFAACKAAFPSKK